MTDISFNNIYSEYKGYTISICSHNWEPNLGQRPLPQEVAISLADREDWTIVDTFGNTIESLTSALQSAKDMIDDAVTDNNYKNQE